MAKMIKEGKERRTERTYDQAPDYTPELGDDDKKDIVRLPRHARR